MTSLLRALTHYRQPERGATAVEYALVASLIAAVIVSAVTLLGQDVQGLFETVRW